MSFQDLGLNQELASHLASNGINNPSDIQKEVFPLIRQGDSVITLSKTGTGKTLAYLAPLVQRYVEDLGAENNGKAWGLVLVPTRELADQVSKNLKLLAADKIPTVVIVGGESANKQVEMGAKAAIYVATPGRFLDLLDRRLVNPDQLKVVVFDEADRILDMGFVNDIRIIRKKLPRDLQLCFFSATIHFGIDELSYEFGVEAKRVGKEQDELTAEGLEHRVAFVGDHEKFHALVNFLKLRAKQRGIIFTNYKERAEEIVIRLRGLGLHAESLTSNLNQAARSRAMENFRSGKTQLLVGSDLAARGLDVQDLDFVINMALPEESATYLHRVGRTARAGKKGIALSLIGFDDTYRLEDLKKFLGKDIEKFEFTEDELTGPLHRFSNERLNDRERPEGAPSHAPRREGGRPPRAGDRRPAHSGPRRDGDRPAPRPAHAPRGAGSAHPPRREHAGSAAHSAQRPRHAHAPRKSDAHAPAKPKGVLAKLKLGIKKLFGVKTAETAAPAPTHVAHSKPHGHVPQPGHDPHRNRNNRNRRPHSRSKHKP